MNQSLNKLNDTLFLVQARLNSQRVPRKMIKPFADSNLYGILLDKLLQSEHIPQANIYASVHEEELRQEAESRGINIFERSYESANNDNDITKIYEWHDVLDFKYVVIISACNPLLKVETIDNFVSQWAEQEEENLFGVIKLKDYFWNKEGMLTTPWPNGQSLMNTKAVEETYKAAHVLYASRMDLVKDYKFMGDFQAPGGIKLFEMEELETFDIDYSWQFEVAEVLYKKFVLDAE